jgi:hypothetical protein
MRRGTNITASASQITLTGPSSASPQSVTVTPEAPSRHSRESRKQRMGSLQATQPPENIGILRAE